MIQGTHDPATPYEGAAAVQAGLTNGTSMFVVESYNYIQVFSNQCARDAAAASRMDGTPPEDGTRCELVTKAADGTRAFLGDAKTFHRDTWVVPAHPRSATHRPGRTAEPTRAAIVPLRSQLRSGSPSR